VEGRHRLHISRKLLTSYENVFAVFTLRRVRNYVLLFKKSGNFFTEFLKIRYEFNGVRTKIPVLELNTWTFRRTNVIGQFLKDQSVTIKSSDSFRILKPSQDFQ
jgi:hypothetical protein